MVGITGHSEPGFVSPENSWDHIQLTVGCTVYGAVEMEEGNEECDAADDVVSTINSRLGFPMLRWEGWVADGQDIQITLNTPLDVGSDQPCGEPGECFTLTGTGNIYDRCEIRTTNVAGAGNLQWLVIYHGLGHCLGLDHDDHDRSGPLVLHSIMQPVQRPTPDGEIPRWFDDWDRDLLRDKYNE